MRGTRDQFCENGPWQAVRPRLTSPDITVHTVEGGDHGLKVKGGKVSCKGLLSCSQLNNSCNSGYEDRSCGQGAWG